MEPGITEDDANSTLEFASDPRKLLAGGHQMTIFKSPYPDVPVSDHSITQNVFAGIDPDMVILVDGPSGREMTGAQFMASVKALAGGLLEQGFGTGTVVALMAPNIPEYCVIFHAVAWAGGTITTINPTYTDHEVRHQLEDSSADILISISMFADTAKAAAKGTKVDRIVIIDEAPEGTEPLSGLIGTPLEEQVPVDLDNHNLCLPYSSGTTGLPKGVMLSHRNLSTNLEQIRPISGISAGDMSVAFLPFFHIYGLEVMMNAHLAIGAGLVTMPRFDLEMFLRLCQDHKTRSMWIVPPVALALAKHPLVDQYDLTCVKRIFSGAAPLGGDVAESVAARLNAQVDQGYGMTEMSPVSHASPAEGGRKGASGVSVPSTLSRIVDPETGQNQPAGESGELWVKGPQIMRGYLNRDDATAETIVEDGWLRTGDIAHFDEDGFLYVTDRLKELIKYKGFQVAPAELEAELVGHPKIIDAAVIGKPDDEAGELPYAFVVPPPGSEAPTLDEVQDYLAPRLSSYKQIRMLEVVEEIPKSASGKILRRFLRDGLS
jgi:4-coumarate--CoA ligase